MYVSVIFMCLWEMHPQNFSAISSTYLSSRFSWVNKKAVLVFDFMYVEPKEGSQDNPLVQYESVSELKTRCMVSCVHTNLSKPENHITAGAMTQRMHLYWFRTCADTFAECSTAIWIYRIRCALAWKSHNSIPELYKCVMFNKKRLRKLKYMSKT